MTDFLMFQLHGPLAAWGDVAVGEYRPSLGHPSKSAIQGLLAAAMGVDRESESTHQSMATGYGVGVCIRSAGDRLRDYHTTQVPDGRHSHASRKDELTRDPQRLNTILSQRDYLTDHYCQVAVWRCDEQSPFSLAELQAGLAIPEFTLCLGRKSCPPDLPLNAIIVEDLTLKDAFHHYHEALDTQMIFPILDDSHTVYVWQPDGLGAEGAGMTSSMTLTRQDQLTSRARWQFADRQECFYSESNEGNH